MKIILAFVCDRLRKKFEFSGSFEHLIFWQLLVNISEARKLVGRFGSLKYDRLREETTQKVQLLKQSRFFTERRI